MVEVETLSKEKESREGGMEGLVKGMERKLELKEMVIKVGLDCQIFREFSLQGKESELELLREQGKSSGSTPTLESPVKRTLM